MLYRIMKYCIFGVRFSVVCAFVSHRNLFLNLLEIQNNYLLLEKLGSNVDIKAFQLY